MKIMVVLLFMTYAVLFSEEPTPIVSVAYNYPISSIAICPYGESLAVVLDSSRLMSRGPESVFLFYHKDQNVYSIIGEVPSLHARITACAFSLFGDYIILATQSIADSRYNEINVYSLKDIIGEPNKPLHSLKRYAQYGELENEESSFINVALSSDACYAAFLKKNNFQENPNKRHRLFLYDIQDKRLLEYNVCDYTSTIFYPCLRFSSDDTNLGISYCRCTYGTFHPRIHNLTRYVIKKAFDGQGRYRESYSNDDFILSLYPATKKASYIDHFFEPYHLNSDKVPLKIAACEKRFMLVDTKNTPKELKFYVK